MSKKNESDEKLHIETLRLFYDQTRKYKRDSLLMILNPLSAVAINVGIPFFAGISLEQISTNGNDFNKNIILLFVCVVVGIVLNRLGFQALMRTQAKVMSDLSEIVYERVLARGVRYHINNIGGKLVSDANDFFRSYMDITQIFFVNGASFFITVVIGLLVVFTQSVPLGIFILVIISIVGFLVYLDTSKRSLARTIRMEAYRVSVAHYSDSIVNAITVKLFGAEENEQEKYKSLNRHLKEVRLIDWQTAGKSGNSRMALLTLSIVLLLIFLNYLSKNDPSNIGLGLFAFTYTFSLILRLFEINNITRTVEEAFLKSRPVINMLMEPVEVTDNKNAEDIQVSMGGIEFSNVVFAYADGNKDEKIFDGLSISIKPGEKIGFVGSSGGGKTTLTRLLLRFEDINSGSITIDDQNIADVTQVSLRKSIGYVPQEPLLFHRTIKENIAYGKETCSEAEIIQSAKDAQAHDFIEKLPKGYDTIVGERGVKLSGGQRQRVAIARAILKNAPILVLDEATSALDSESEIYVQRALSDLIKDKTTIAIAHRLSTIQKMDKILVLENGQIIEQGTHKELLAKGNGQYAKLWKHQSGGFLQEE